MADEDIWDLISDTDDWGIPVDLVFTPPVSKSSPALPPPTFQHNPRSPAMFQVPSALRQSSSSSGALTRDCNSWTGCRFTVNDTTVHSKPHFGMHRASPYQLNDLHPGVNDRPVRTGYHPQSFQVRSCPPMRLQTNSHESSDLSDPLPPQPVILQGKDAQKALDKSLTIQRRGGSKSQQTQLVRLKKPSDSTMLTAKFDSLLNEFGPESEVFSALAATQFPEAHRNRLLDAYAASTVFRYCQAVQQFSKTVATLGFALPELTVPQLVDCLASMTHSRAQQSDAMSGNFTLKALRWFRKIASVACLEIVYSPLADSFLKVRLTSDKREAPPLPLWILFQWERRVLYSQSSTFEVIMLGSFLFIAWASLRFSDAQRLNVESLVLTDSELRGMVWTSKSRANGHPFGIVSSGICSTGSFTWLVKFLRTWDTLLSESGMTSCDFLIPDLSEQGKFLSQEPLGYAAALQIFRTMLQTPWKRFSGKHPLTDLQLNYTLHSLKATLLSFGPQLGSAVDPDDRLQQGHHADPRKSLHLYGRDSVWGSLRYQTTVVTKIREGFRPKTAQHRGGQSPLIEPPVLVELFKKQAEDFTYQWLPFNAAPVSLEVEEVSMPEEISSSSDSSSDESSQSHSPDANQNIDQKTTVNSFDSNSCDEIIIAKHRRVTHAMILSSSSDENVPRYMEKGWRPACGTHMSRSETMFLDEWNNDLSFCQHPGCKKAWTALGMF